jgi:translation initiation factor 6
VKLLQAEVFFLSLKLADISGNPFIGVFCRPAGKIVFCPLDASPDFIIDLEEGLEVKGVRATIGGTNLHGSLMGANSKGLIVPYFYDIEEIDRILGSMETSLEELEIRGARSDDPHTAWGNNILASDRVALVNPEVSQGSIEMIEDTLDVEVVKGTIAGVKTVGSVAALNSSGMIVHPKAVDDEVEELRNLFKLDVNICTANFGSPYLGASLIVNDKGALAGKRTSGVEMNRIENSLDLI